jgi:hypothetical protein
MRFNRLFWAGLAVGVFFGLLILLGLAIGKAQGHPPDVPNPGIRPSPNPGPVISLPNDCTILRDAVLANVDNRAEGYAYRMSVLRCTDIPYWSLPKP